MKNSTRRKPIVIASLTIACAGVAGAFFLAGGTSLPANSDDTLTMLGRVSAPEVPALAARLVAQASPEAREAKAVEVLRAVNALAGSSALTFAVGAIAETTPTVAATVVGEAAQLQPAASLACVKVAASAAPLQTEAIVSRAIQQQPRAYAQVAIVAAEAAPSRRAEILGGVNSALPQIQPFVTRAVGQTGAQTGLASVMAQVNQMVVSAAQTELVAVKSPSVAPGAAVTPPQSVFLPLVAFTQKGPPVVTPLTPPVTPPTEHGVGDTTPQSGNDRDYSAP